MSNPCIRKWVQIWKQDRQCQNLIKTNGLEGRTEVRSDEGKEPMGTTTWPVGKRDKQDRMMEVNRKTQY
jgi:hypothetical protein